MVFSFSAYHSLYQSHRAMFHRELPDPISIQDTIERWAFGLYQAYIKYFMSAFDLPEVRKNKFRDTKIFYNIFHNY